jgi:nitrous oxide reductase accessory protein NosL
MDDSGYRSVGRRSVLAAVGGAVAAAGCLGAGSPESPDDGDDTEEPSFPDHPGDEPIDPPERRRCDGPCGMSPSQYPDWNAQIAHGDGSGVFFDSAGCLVAYYQDPTFYDGPAAPIERAWVRDFDTKELVAAADATFVLDYSKERHEEVMAHNPKPFADRAAALEYADRYGDLGADDLAGIGDFGAEQAHRYRDYPLE